MRIFVYGTLKTGYALNKNTIGSNKNCSKVGEGVISGFDMYSNGYYPYIVEVEDKSHKVFGEVWEVNDSVMMTDLRNIEREYEETEVEVEIDGDKEMCIAYVYKNDIRDSWAQITSGVFSR